MIETTGIIPKQLMQQFLNSLALTKNEFIEFAKKSLEIRLKEGSVDNNILKFLHDPEKYSDVFNNEKTKKVMTEIWNKYVGNTLPGSNENILTQAINTSSQSTTYKLADIASKSIEEKQSIFDEYFKELTQFNYSDYINKQIEPLLNNKIANPSLLVTILLTVSKLPLKNLKLFSNFLSKSLSNFKVESFSFFSLKSLSIKTISPFFKLFEMEPANPKLITMSTSNFINSCAAFFDAFP